MMNDIIDELYDKIKEYLRILNLSDKDLISYLSYLPDIRLSSGDMIKHRYALAMADLYMIETLLKVEKELNGGIKK